MEKVSEKDIESNKDFWNLINPFFTHKGALDNGDITLIDKNCTISNDECLAKKFNEYCINILKESSGKNPFKIGKSFHKVKNYSAIKYIFEVYKDDASPGVVVITIAQV